MKEAIQNAKAQPVYFYDDRSKVKDFLVLVAVLYEDEKVCLCTATWLHPKKLRDIDKAYAKEVYTLLFDKDTREVLHKDWDSWLASLTEF